MEEERPDMSTFKHLGCVMSSLTQIMSLKSSGQIFNFVTTRNGSCLSKYRRLMFKLLVVTKISPMETKTIVQT